MGLNLGLSSANQPGKERESGEGRSVSSGSPYILGMEKKDFFCFVSLQTMFASPPSRDIFLDRVNL
jgi:hypothetical protein